MIRGLIKQFLRILYGRFRDNFKIERYPRFAIDRHYYTDFKRYANYPADAKFANLGAGSSFHHKRWTSYDFYNDFYDQIISNKKSIDFTKTNKLNEKYYLMYCSHVFEHIPRKNLDGFLKLIYKGLVPNGTIRIQVPDAGAIYNAYLTKNYDFFNIYSSRLPKDFDDDWKLEYLLLFLVATAKVAEPFDLTYYKTIQNNSRTMNMSDFFDWLLDGVEENTSDGQQHVNWFDYEKLKLQLKKSGFSEVYLSGFGQSRHAPMKQIPLFDGWLPSISMYAEAKK